MKNRPPNPLKGEFVGLRNSTIKKDQMDDKKSFYIYKVKEYY